MSVVPFAWKDRPSLIEVVLPAQKISAEAQKERKANLGQTLTGLAVTGRDASRSSSIRLVFWGHCFLQAMIPKRISPSLKN